MWLGETLSRLELLTLASLLAQGHDVTLWAYDEIRTPIPRHVRIADAERIFPRSKIRPKKHAEPSLGVGPGSVGGVFSDLFRYRVLHEHGGIWTDMDVTALRPLDFAGDYAFRPQRGGMVGTIMKCPAESPLMREAYEATARVADEHTPWLLPITLLNDLVRAHDLERFIVPEMSNRDKWTEVWPFIASDAAFPECWYAFHWMNERWRTLSLDSRSAASDAVPSKDEPAAGSTLHALYRRYGLLGD